MDLESAATVHAALGDVNRLRLVRLLIEGDLTVNELSEEMGMKGNLLAHHLRVLDGAGLVERRASAGDHRRRYVVLRWDVLDEIAMPRTGPRPDSVLFVCDRNSARSQYAAHRWEAMTGTPAMSAGRRPAPAVHPLAVTVAAEEGIDLGAAEPKGYETIEKMPDLVISVCDRAREDRLPKARRNIHWSVPDPVTVGSPHAFRTAFGEIRKRIEQRVSNERSVQ